MSIASAPHRLTASPPIDATIAAIRDRISLPLYIGRSHKLEKHGEQYRCCCPFHSEKTASFVIYPDGHYHCFGCGAHGDILDYVGRTKGLPLLEAIKYLTDEAGLSDPVETARAAARAKQLEEEARRREEERSKRRTSEAQGAVNSAGPIESSPAATYLAARGLSRDRLGVYPSDLKYVPSASYRHWDKAKQEWVELGPWGAMVSAIRDIAGEIVAAHLTYLEDDGSGKRTHYHNGGKVAAKKITGPYAGGAIRLTPTIGNRILVGEGIESSLSALVVERWAGRAATVWAAATLGNICGAGLGQGELRALDDPRRDPEKPETWRLPSEVPHSDRPGIRLPQEMRTVVLLQENDSKDPAAYRALLRRAVRRFEGEGRTVLVADPGIVGDFNDLLLQSADAGGRN
jgi:CHC2 zinc finger